MKRPKLCTGFLLFVALLLCGASCENRGLRNGAAKESAGLDTVRVSKRSHLEGDTANPYCDIQVEFIYPVTSTGVSVDTLQLFFVQNMLGAAYNTLPPEKAVEAYAQNYIENYKYDAETYQDAVSDMIELNALIPGIDLSDSEHNVNERFYSYYETLSNSIVFNRYGIISFQVVQSNNKGGAASLFFFRITLTTVISGNRLTKIELLKAG